MNRHNSFLAYITMNELGAWKNYRTTYNLFLTFRKSSILRNWWGGGMKEGQSCWIAAGQTAPRNPDKYKQISMPTVIFFQVFSALHKYLFSFDQSVFWRPRGKDGTGFLLLPPHFISSRPTAD